MSRFELNLAVNAWCWLHETKPRNLIAPYAWFLAVLGPKRRHGSGLWGGSIFIYGAATPWLGTLGPSVGWPLSLAVGLVVANIMGTVLGEWSGAAPRAVKFMWSGLAILLSAIVLCGISARLPE